MPLLPPVAFDLSHRHALDAERRKRFAHFVELEGFDDRRNKLHLPSFRVIASAGRTPGFNKLSRTGPTFGSRDKQLKTMRNLPFLAFQDSKTGKAELPINQAIATFCTVFDHIFGAR
jgi:hypothetical protein